MKLEEAEIAQLKKQAKLNGLTMTDLLMQGLKDTGRQFHLESQIKDLQSQIKELQAKTGHKIRYTEYVSVPVSRIEKERIRQLAHESRLSNGRYLRECLTGKKNLPELPTVQS